MSLLRNMMSGSVGLSYSDLVIAHGATHYYRCNEASGSILSDSVGTAHMSLTGSYTLGNASFNGDPATSLNLSGGFASVAQSLIGQGNPTPITIESWIYPTSSVVGVILHSQNDSGHTNSSLQYRGSESPAEFRYDKFPPTASQLGAGVSYALSNTYYLLYEEDVGVRRLYVNNVLVASNASPENYTGGTITHTGIGRQPIFGSEAFYGRLKDVATYSRILSSTERTSHWNAAKL